MVSARVQKGDVVLDCGANIVTFARETLSAGAKLVVAIEPSERNVEGLAAQLRRRDREGPGNHLSKGVWHREEELKFFVYGNSALDSFVMPERIEEHSKPREVRMPVTAIDLIVTELKLDRVDFIKMDIEGAERHAMNGAQTTLAKFHRACRSLSRISRTISMWCRRWCTRLGRVTGREFGRCTLLEMGLFSRTLCSSISANQTSSTLSVDASPHPTKPLSYRHCDWAQPRPKPDPCESSTASKNSSA
jgi:FkbM family methyltransferase